MNSKNFIYISCVVVFLAGILQSTQMFNVLGVKPNLVMAIILTSLFFLSFGEYLVLIMAGIISLKFFSGFENEALLFLALLFLAFVVKKYILGAGTGSVLILVVSLTVIFYAIFMPQAILYNPHILFLELLYNCLISIVIYLFLDLTYEKI